MAERIAAKFAKQAERLAKTIETLRRPRLDNTPKRALQAKSARIAADQTERIRRALLALAHWHETGDAKAVFYTTVQTLDDVNDLVRTKVETPSYYEIHDTGRHVNTTAFAVQFRADVEAFHGAPAKSPADIRRDEIAAAVERVRFLKIPGFFPTPPDVCERIAGAVAAWLRSVHNPPAPAILEPSAGIGDLADAVRARLPDARITCVELRHQMADICHAKGHVTYRGDFMGDLARTGTGYDFHPDSFAPPFDAVVMNPPYENNAALLHVMRAWQFVRPGGRLWAVMPGPVAAWLGPNGFAAGANKSIPAAFVEMIHGLPHRVEMLPAGSFKNAFNPTGVATCLLTLGDGAECA